MYCKKCGTKLADGERFCHKCGAQVEDYEAWDIPQTVSNSETSKTQQTEERKTQQREETEQEIAATVSETVEPEEEQEKREFSAKYFIIGASAVIAAALIVLAVVPRIFKETEVDEGEEAPLVMEPEYEIAESEEPEVPEEPVDVVYEADQLTEYQQNMLGPMQAMIFAHLDNEPRSILGEYSWSAYETSWDPLNDLINDWAETYDEEDDHIHSDGEHSVLISGDFLKECASALYADFDGIFPDIPETSKFSYGISAKEGKDFRFTVNDWGEQYRKCKIESWTEHTDGSQTVMVGTYSGDTPTGTFQFELVENPYTQNIEDPFFNYSISTMQETDQGDELYSEYFLPESNSRYYSEDELKKAYDGVLSYAWMEIYARHGRIFLSYPYFDNKSWYEGTVEPEDFNEDVFNEYEKANLETILTMLDEYGDASVTDSDALFKESRDIIRDYGFYKDNYLYEDDGEYSYSNLHFTLYIGTLEDKGDYCYVQAMFYKPVYVPSNLEIGDTVTVCTDELEGTTEELTYIETENGETGLATEGSDYPSYSFEYTGEEDMSEVSLYDIYGRLDCAFYNGVLRIRKDALTGAPISQQPDETASKYYLMEQWCYFDAVSFDDNGYVTQLIYTGE